METARPASHCSQSISGPAPAAIQFPEYPLSWYLFCAAADLRDKPLTKSLLGRELVAFRTASGRIAVLDARCSHLGADLGRGRVLGETIQCPFHHWQYGPDGQCVRIPAQSYIPPLAHQRAYPVAVRHGYVFFFNGRDPWFDLPFFPGCSVNDYRAGRVFTLYADCPWYMFSANAFDSQHWAAVHDREVIEGPFIDSPHQWAYRIHLRAQVTGHSIFDRLLRRFAGQRVDIDITNYGGSFIVVNGLFRRVHSRMILCTTPLGAGRPLEVNTIVFVKGGRYPLARAFWDPISLWVRRVFTYAFVEHEFHELAGIRYRPLTLIDADQDMIGWFHWVASLPQESACADVRQASGEPVDGILPVLENGSLSR